jgi:hypothetical protein
LHYYVGENAPASALPPKRVSAHGISKSNARTPL